jgi:hypothetical protein
MEILLNNYLLIKKNQKVLHKSCMPFRLFIVHGIPANLAKESNRFTEDIAAALKLLAIMQPATRAS